MNKSFSSLPFNKGNLLPQEEMLAVAKKKSKLIIGIPKEDQETENCVPLTPEAVELLVKNEHEILLEQGSGVGANYLDTDYSECGGFIIANKSEVLKADIVLKIAPFTIEEANMLKGNQLVISNLHINGQTKEYIKTMMQKKLTAIASEQIKDEQGGYPIEDSMNAISGITAIHVAAEYLSTLHSGNGVMLGGISGITPAEVVILGTNTAAEFAARAALGMGASVKIFSDSISQMREIQYLLGQSLYTSIFHPRVMEKALRSADVVIGALSVNDQGSKFFVSKDLVKCMKKGSMIIDLSIDQGGCFETSECRTQKDPVFIKHDVIHYCVPNITSRVARTASIALSNVFAPLLLRIGESGGFVKYIAENPSFRSGIYIYNGILTNRFIGSKYDIPSQDINLLMAAF